MDLSTSLGVIGLLIGLWGIYLAIKQNRYPAEVTLIKENWIPLFDTIVKNISELAVLYKSAPINPNLVLIHATLLNTGSKDSNQSMVEKPITLTLPTGHKWLEAKVITKANDAVVELKIDRGDTINVEHLSFTLGDTITVNHHLFRCNEYIAIQALAEVPHRGNNCNAELWSAIKLDHRISDMGKIKEWGPWGQALIN